MARSKKRHPSPKKGGCAGMPRKWGGARECPTQRYLSKICQNSRNRNPAKKYVKINIQLANSHQAPTSSPKLGEIHSKLSWLLVLLV